MFDLFDKQEAPAKARKSLRPHQTNAIDLLRRSFGKGFRRTVVQGPTGFGKTLVAANIIESALAKGNAVIFTAPAVNLIDQTVAAFEAEGIRDIGVMQANHPRTNALARVQVASVQTLARRDIPKASMVIVDECHIGSKVIDALMRDRPDVFFVGLSATPWAKGMGLLWQDLVIPITIGELIDQGFLSKFVVYAPDVPDMSGVKTVAGDYVESDVERIMSEGGIVGSIVQNWLTHGENRPTLCFCVNRAHADRVHRDFAAAGVASAYVDGETDGVERDIIRRRFRSREVSVICSVRTMTTGVDLPISCLIDAAPTQSKILHVQKIGRGLRVNPGTEDCVVFDHAGNSLRLGLVTDIHQTRLDTTPKGEKEKRKPPEKLPRPCVACGVLYLVKLCPACGHERVPVSGVEAGDGDLVPISGKVDTSREAKQAFWSGLLTVQHARGRSSGWTAHAYKEKFGVWPRGLDDVAGVASADVWNFVKAKDIRYAKGLGKGAGK